MGNDLPLGFWLRFGDEWRRFELDRLSSWVMSSGGRISVRVILTDPDARLEPLPLLAQRFDADGLRCRTRAFTIEASVKLTACEVETRGTSNRSAQDPNDPVAKACTLLVSVEYNAR